jgi:hypothetical protein
MNDEITQVAIDELADHPQNPRLFLREDVIDGITAQLTETGYFDPAHALLVRPVNGHYEIVRGHHRKAAAQRAGFASVPCWVREMTDEEAYMQLALGNVQGELSPLEIGIHALRAIDLADGGRGVKGGLSGYAAQLGVNRGNLSSYRSAAEVLVAANLFNVKQVLDKAMHLAAVHALPAELWPMLAQWVITENDKGNTPSVAQTQDMVKEIAKLAAPQDWTFFLPLFDLADSYLRSKTPTPQTVKELWQAASGIAQIITANADRFGERFPYSVEDFEKWLSGGVGTYAWDLRELQEYRSTLIAAAQDAQRPQPANVQPGEWYLLGRHTLYCGDTSAPDFWSGMPSAQFAFADPPYNADAAVWDSGFEWKHDWLIDKAEIVAVTPGIGSIQSFFAHDTQMPYAWSMACWIKNGMTRGALGFGNWIYAALFTRQSIHRNAQDIIEVTIKTGQTNKTEHKGRKPDELLERLIEVFTVTGDTVIDPFLGSGTTLFAADRTGRTCIGGEINPEFCNEIINRWQADSGQEASRI